MSRDGTRRGPRDQCDLTDAGRTLLQELRALKERSGLDLRAIESRTYASRSSWGRWLKGDCWIPLAAVEELADLCGGDRRRLRALWELARTDRRETSEAGAVPTEAGAVPTEAATPSRPDAQDTEPRPAAGGRSSRMRTVMTLVYIVLAGVAGVAIGLYVRESPAPQRQLSNETRWISRSEIIARARSWKPHTAQRIPYAQDRTFTGYRTDGSGYAAMVFRLPEPGPISSELASAVYSRRIPASELRTGDLIIRELGGVDVREVIIFDRWTDSERTAYWAYQQRRDYGTDRLILHRGLTGNDDYFAHRPLNIREASYAG
jgi:hypothetical protein